MLDAHRGKRFEFLVVNSLEVFSVGRLQDQVVPNCGGGD
jgi:hypothetical protein